MELISRGCTDGDNQLGLHRWGYTDGAAQMGGYTAGVAQMGLHSWGCTDGANQLGLHRWG